MKILTPAVLLVAAALVASAAGATANAKLSLYGPYGGAHCDGSGITAGAVGGYGFAMLRGRSTVRAKVRVTGISPNTTYDVRLIQGVADCGVTDASFTTNALGNGHVTLQEPAVSTHAYVFIEDGPATQFYVTETYLHAL